MLSYKEMDNLAAVEIEISDRVSTKEFDATAKKLEAFIARHGRVRVRNGPPNLAPPSWASCSTSKSGFRRRYPVRTALFAFDVPRLERANL
jgi:hypothetical protein